ncbi:2OG-Fe(II) oxygenase [Yimella sp. cx-51]|uniref:2OG-Fe(II) oxygenase n=1 Tax=Yimella sp. cx-51 TaxID=2770551 RepID=UPI00165D5366|nr:2OG-Fe(II) oxygenase [Yimella sp. cx-51]MBC9957452.1 2OG-Fe(II) oxygenase [Yimella sp. cx-51]QTH39311.1 2OG-Fe(II) oxygenase [Yimella sp. cx-51]
MSLDLVDLPRLRAELDAIAPQYRGARPFPHVVLDNVLKPEAFTAAVAAFPATDDPFWKGYLHVNETKYSNTEPDTWSPVLRAIAQDFCSEEFVAFLEELTGISGLLPDWSMDGGGLHQTLRGGHLNIHTDFSTHHDHEDWARRVNILLYLNESWPEEWGGQLELWNKDVTRREGLVTPLGNRMLVFTTSGESFHGHPDGLNCPPGEARRSLALYYFTVEDSAVRKSTNYRARPDEGLKRYAIAADRVVLDMYDRAKRRLNLSDSTVQAALERVHTVRRQLRRR